MPFADFSMSYSYAATSFHMLLRYYMFHAADDTLLADDAAIFAYAIRAYDMLFIFPPWRMLTSLLPAAAMDAFMLSLMPLAATC